MNKIISNLFLFIVLYSQVFSQHPLLEEKKKNLNPLQESRELINNGMYQKAQWLLEDFLHNSGESENKFEGHYLLVLSFVAQKKYEDAYFASKELLKLSFPEFYAIRLVYFNAISAFYTERYAPAIESLQKLLQQTEDNVLKFNAYYWLAASYFRSNYITQAEEYITLANQNFDSTSYDFIFEPVGKDDVLFLWVEILEKKGDIKQAITKLEQFIVDFEKSSLFVDAKLKLAINLMQIGKYGSALNHLNSVQPSKSTHKSIWLFSKAEAEYALSDYESASKDYKLFLNNFPAGKLTRKAKYGLAWSYLKLNDYNNSVKYFRQVLESNDSLTESSLFQIGLILSLMDSSAAAVTTFEELIEKFPYGHYSDKAYYQIGMIRFRAGQYPEARRSFQIAARLFPDSEIRADSYRMLGELSLIVGDLSNAQFAFSQVQKFSRSDTLTAIAIFQEGVALYQLGRFRSSSEKFSEYLKKFKNHSKYAEGYFWLAEALYQDAKYGESESAYLNAIKHLKHDNPKRISALYGLAWSLFEQKKFRQAITAFDNFILESPNAAEKLEASLRKADCYFYLRDFENATKIYASLSEDKKNQKFAEYAAFQLALTYIQRGEINRGIEHLRNFLNKFPGSIYSEVVRFNIAWAYFTNEQYKKAIDEFNAFISEYPESQLMPRVLLNKGDAFYNLSEFDSAIVYYKNLIEQFPTSLLRSDAINGLQFAYQAQGRSSEAITVIEELINKQSFDTANEDLLVKKADILFEQGNFGQAANEYLKIIGLQTSELIQAKSLYQLGRCFEYENNPQKAVEYFNLVLNKYPASDYAPQAAMSIAHLLQKQKKYKEAIDYLKLFDVNYANSSLVWEARYNLGVALLNQKDLENAKKQFDKVITLAPSNEVFAYRSRLQIARMLQNRKLYHISNDTLTVIINNLSDDIAAEALLLMGENYLLLKDPKSALEAFNQVIEAFANYPLLVERALLGSGECYERLKDRNQARRVYQQIIQNPIDPVVKKDAEDRLRRLK